MVDDSDKYTKEKFVANGAKEIETGVDPIKAESWINNIETTFRAMQVPHRHKTKLATCMILKKKYNWWERSLLSDKGRSIPSCGLSLWQYLMSNISHN